MAPGAKQRRRARLRNSSLTTSSVTAALPEADDGGQNAVSVDCPDEGRRNPRKRKAETELKSWKSVAMAMDIQQAFEADGGMMFEEMDGDADVQYGATVFDVASEIPKTKKRKKSVSDKREKNPDSKINETTLNPGQSLEEVVGGWMQFELHPLLLRGLAKLGFSRPTEVQRRCLDPAVRQRKDVVAAAETGSGKTLAFGLPILHHVLNMEYPIQEEDVLSKSENSTSHFPKRRRMEGGLRGLIILPTRELAVQVQNHINAVAALAPLVPVQCLVGGISLLKQKRLLQRKPHIVVGTPGRIAALMGLSKNASDTEDVCDWFRQGVSELRHLVLDEADRLVESGHFRELDTILAHVYGALVRPQQLQTFVFSATLTLDPRSAYLREKQGDEGGKLGALMRRLCLREGRALHTADLTVDDGTAAKKDGNQDVEDPVTSHPSLLPAGLSLLEAVAKDAKDKESVLTMWLLRRYRWKLQEEGNSEASAEVGGRVVVFVNAISSVSRLSSILALLMESPEAAAVLSKVGMSRQRSNNGSLTVQVFPLHSRMRQKERMKRMERFRKSKHAILVCTDIAARGLDVPELAAVVHYQTPRGAEIFVHRSGRTARAGKLGESIAVVAPGEALLWNRLYRAINVSKEQIGNVLITSEELSVAKEVVRAAADLESQVHKEHKAAGNKSWMQRTANQAELMLSEDEDDPDQGRSAAPKKRLWGLYQQLQARVHRPPRRVGGARPSKRRK